MKVKSTRVNQRDPSVTVTVQRVEIKKTEEFNYRGSTSGEWKQVGTCGEESAGV